MYIYILLNIYIKQNSVHKYMWKTYSIWFQFGVAFLKNKNFGSTINNNEIAFTYTIFTM